jgi:hypothetical protein
MIGGNVAAKGANHGPTAPGRGAVGSIRAHGKTDIRRHHIEKQDRRRAVTAQTGDVRALTETAAEVRG